MYPCEYILTVMLMFASVVADELDSLYHVAGIEFAVLGSSNWAGLLGPDDIDLLEYAADLKVCDRMCRE